jgi:hypothetical protein
MNATVVSNDIGPADRVSNDDRPPDLTYLNGFSSEDLVYNREGRLSPNQQLELRRTARGKAYEICIVVAFAIFNLVVFHATPVFVSIIGGFVIYYAVRLVQRVDELREGVVHEVVGDAWAQFVPDSEGPDRYWLHIDGLKLEISDTAYASFRRGGPYRIYYVATTNTAIGGEVLPDWRPLPAPTAGRRWWQNLGISVGVE